MEKSILCDIDLLKNQIKNASISPLSLPPSSPVTGQIYFDTTKNSLGIYDGSSWRYNDFTTELVMVAEQGVSVEAPYIKFTVGGNVSRLSLSDINSGSDIFLEYLDSIVTRWGENTAVIITGGERVYHTNTEYDHFIPGSDYYAYIKSLNKIVFVKYYRPGNCIYRDTEGWTDYDYITGSADDEFFDDVDEPITTSVYWLHNDQVSLTQSEYDALSDSEKNNGTTYLIKESTIPDLIDQLPLATTSSNGLMSAEDKTFFNNKGNVQIEYSSASFYIDIWKSGNMILVRGRQNTTEKIRIKNVRTKYEGLLPLVKFLTSNDDNPVSYEIDNNGDLIYYSKKNWSTIVLIADNFAPLPDEIASSDIVISNY